MTRSSRTQLIGSRATSLAFITILYLQNWQIWTSADKTNPVCNTPECQRLATFYKQNMNVHKNPCTNFYEYVCGQWGDHNPRPKHEPMWMVHKTMEDRVDAKLKELLEDKHAESVPEFQKAKDFYKACINLPFMDKAAPNVVKDIMKKIGNWPMFLPENKEIPPNVQWSQIDDEYIKIAGKSAFFNHQLKLDTRKDNQITVLLKLLYSPHGMLKPYKNWVGKEQHKHYKAFLRKVIESVAPSNYAAAKKVIDIDLENVMKFRDQLNQVINEADRIKTFDFMTILHFQESYNFEAYTKDTAQIDWWKKIHAMYKDGKNAYGEAIQSSDRIAVQTDYFELLANLLGRTSKRVIVNHIHLYFAEMHVILTPEMEKDLENSCGISNEKLPDATITYVPTQRWQRCVRTHEMVTTLGRMYVKNNFPQRKVHAVQDLLAETRSVLNHQVRESKWLDPVTKLKAFDKINYYSWQVGFPDWYEPAYAKTLREKFDVNPVQIDAYFVQNRDKLYVTAGYLQWPVYSENVPYVIDYGSTVSMLGHEFYHGFDTEGLKFHRGSKREWLTPKMYDEHGERMACFKKQYDEYKKKEALKLLNPPTSQIELSNTVNEDMADVMGLKLAYKGYREKLKQNKGKCSVLPGFENFGCEKLFFIAFANGFCGNSEQYVTRHMFLHDTHSLPWIRVNGAVANMKEFGQAFGCKTTDPLRPSRTCDLWN